jgi:hypothetical protein
MPRALDTGNFPVEITAAEFMRKILAPVPAPAAVSCGAVQGGAPVGPPPPYPPAALAALARRRG